MRMEMRQFGLYWALMRWEFNSKFANLTLCDRNRNLFLSEFGKANWMLCPWYNSLKIQTLNEHAENLYLDCNPKKASMDFLFKCPFPINVQRATPLFSHCQKKKKQRQKSTHMSKYPQLLLRSQWLANPIKPAILLQQLWPSATHRFSPLLSSAELNSFRSLPCQSKHLTKTAETGE